MGMSQFSPIVRLRFRISKIQFMQIDNFCDGETASEGSGAGMSLSSW
jgi:hypothetical protein